MRIPPMPPRDDRPAGDRCEVTLRDTFAAAALTGLLANGDYSVESTPTLAWRMADAMLAERKRLQADNAGYTDGISASDRSKRFAFRETRNGAVSGCETVPDPDSRVWHTAGHATPSEGTQEPVAWAVTDGYWFHDVRLAEWTAQNYADQMNKASGSVKYKAIPLYAAPQGRVVRLPALVWQHAAYIGEGERHYKSRVLEALDAAGVKWEVAE